MRRRRASGMMRITEHIVVREEELQFEFVQAAGPGGQNVNKVASAVRLRFDTNTPALPTDVRERLLRIAGKKIGKEGVLLIEARRYRSQERNRQDALERLAALLRKASEPPKERKKGRVSAADKAKRLEAKRKRGEVKRLRGRIEGGE